MVHELRTLSESFYYFGTVDQLNLGASVGLEILSRRLAAIVEAYSDPAKVDWHSARYYRGVAGVEEAIAPGLRSFVARRAKDDVELHNARQRGSGLRGGPAPPMADGEEAGETAQAARGGGGGRGGGRGRRGRGVPPAQ